MPGNASGLLKRNGERPAFWPVFFVEKRVQSPDPQGFAAKFSCGAKADAYSAPDLYESFQTV
jgi:hypothetical protein